MGSPPDEPDRYANEAQHTVTITRGFLLQDVELTQAAWKEVDGTDPSDFDTLSDDHPVERVDWYSALAYANWASARDGLPRCYSITPASCVDSPSDWTDGETECTGAFVNLASSPSGNIVECPGYRLPTEAEWEYSARAGTTAATYGGPLQIPTGCEAQPNLGPIAWFCANSSAQTHAVGTLAANAWGIHDSLGNVWEWVWDGRMNPLVDAEDPTGDNTAEHRVYRGGSWGDLANGCRAALRYWNVPTTRASYLGFRLARTVR